MKAMAILAMAALLLLAGCAGGNQTAGQTAAVVGKVAQSAPELARQFDQVYAYLVQQKLVPDHLEAATQALAAMDAAAPLVQAGAESLSGDNFNWVKFVLQAAMMTAQIMGYVLPLVI